MYPPIENFEFSADRLKAISQIEGNHFWFAGRQILINNLIKRFFSAGQRILDVGCGTGRMTRSLYSKGFNIVGLDMRPEGLQTTHNIVPQINLIQSRAERLPFGPGSFDGLLALDVIEHADDRQLLSGMEKILKRGGIAILSAPAHPWMWSHRDDAAGHLRRYTKSSLRSLMDETNFTPLKIYNYQFFLLPLVIVSRFIGRTSSFMRDQEENPPKFINRIFSFINRIEARLIEFMPTGSSLVAICKKT